MNTVNALLFVYYHRDDVNFKLSRDTVELTQKFDNYYYFSYYYYYYLQVPRHTVVPDVLTCTN